MTKLSHISCAEVHDLIGYKVRVSDPKHFFHNAVGTIESVDTTTHFVINHMVIGHKIPVPYITISHDVADSVTGLVSKQMVELKAEQLTLNDPRKPETRATHRLVTTVVVR
jgi:hypothetical protein